MAVRRYCPSLPHRCAAPPPRPGTQGLALAGGPSRREPVLIARPANVQVDRARRRAQRRAVPEMLEVPLLSYLIPWEPSPPLVLLFIASIVLYVRGSMRRRVSIARQISFWTGVTVLYLSLHTRLDYYAEHEFFIHRIQHLVLHHLAPLILMAGFPGPVPLGGAAAARAHATEGIRPARFDPAAVGGMPEPRGRHLRIRPVRADLARAVDPVRLDARLADLSLHELVRSRLPGCSTGACCSITAPRRPPHESRAPGAVAGDHHDAANPRGRVHRLLATRPLPGLRHVRPRVRRHLAGDRPDHRRSS